MTERTKNRLLERFGPVLAALVVLAVVILAFGRAAGLLRGYGAPLILLCGAALALVGFSGREIAAAFRDAAGGGAGRPTRRVSALFWEAAARNFWMTGALASVLSFIGALNRLSGSGSGGIAVVASAMAAALLPSVLGLCLAVVCLVPAWKLTTGAHVETRDSGTAGPADSASGAGRRLAPETFAGYVLFVGLIAWTVIQSSWPAAMPILWVFYWPALLIVLGGTLLFLFYAGRNAAGPALTASFALTALAGSLAGLVQVLMAFCAYDIRGVTAAITLTISSCFIGILGILLTGAPWEDRMVKDRRLAKPSTLSRAAWAFFPFLTLFILALTFVFVISPVQK